MHLLTKSFGQVNLTRESIEGFAKIQRHMLIVLGHVYVGVRGIDVWDDTFPPRAVQRLIRINDSLSYVILNLEYHRSLLRELNLTEIVHQTRTT